MSRTLAIEAALEGWRAADRRLAEAVDGDADRLMSDLIRHRNDYQRLAAESMADWLHRRGENEQLLAGTLPSTERFVEGASR